MKCSDCLRDVYDLHGGKDNQKAVRDSRIYGSLADLPEAVTTNWRGKLQCLEHFIAEIDKRGY